MRRRRLVSRIRANRLLGARQPVREHNELPRQTVDLLPLRDDRLVEILDRPVLMRDADFKVVETVFVGHVLSLRCSARPCYTRVMTLHCSWRDMIREAAQRLAAAGVENAPRDARLLLAHALGAEPVVVIMRENDSVDIVMLTAFEEAIQRRLCGEPVSRIRGWREFYGRRFAVTPAVLDPRPETELLVEQGLKRLDQAGRVLDLGIGSGCILVSILAERPDAVGMGLDISPAALALARHNANALGVAGRATFIEGGWGHALPGPFDLALSNPPYISEAEMAGLAKDVRAYDPHIALTPGGDGLDPYRAILRAMPAWLRPGGCIGFEFGIEQAGAVTMLMRQAGLTNIDVHRDLAGIQRAAFGRRAP